MSLVCVLAFGCGRDEETTDPPVPACGDGIVSTGEACDEGEANADDGACTTACALASCGDGLIQAGVEACDDGPANADDAACTAACAAATCGDGLVWAGEEACDLGSANADTAACTSACQTAVCGDGLVWSGFEGCDDANLVGNDGCSASCRLPQARLFADADYMYSILAEVTSTVGASRVSGAGDLDGDGARDIVIGDIFIPLETGETSGGVYVLLDPLVSRDLAYADWIVVGEGPNDSAGANATGAGDVNGDGYDDLAVGAAGRDEGGTNFGAVYILWGGPTVGSATSLADANTKFVGEAAGDQFGNSVSAGGDADGDGRPDLLVGANGLSGNGGAYLVDGDDMGTVSAAAAIARFDGETAVDFAGDEVSWLGDVDGDGVDDFAVGAPTRDENGDQSGTVYVVRGPVQGTWSLGDADASWIGEWEHANLTVAQESPTGDVDGDGRADLVVTENSSSAGEDGAVVVLPGNATGTAGPLDNALASLQGEESPSDVSVGDFTGDGEVDIAVGGGAFGTSGEVRIVTGPIAGTMGWAEADRRITTYKDFEGVGSVVANPGDLDGDGVQDLLVGANLLDQVGLFLGGGM